MLEKESAGLKAIFRPVARYWSWTRWDRSDLADEKEQSPLAGEAKPMERAQKRLQAINAEMRDVQGASDLSPGEKRQRLDALTLERNQLLKDAVLTK